MQWRATVADKHPRARKGDVVACAIKEPPSYGYVSHLLSTVEELVTAGMLAKWHYIEATAPVKHLRLS
ncbi:hypothetical protein MTO96_014340 [Rhipicephalus appendiculatus]